MLLFRWQMVCLCAVVVALGGAVDASRADDPVKTNLDVMEMLIEEVVGELFTQMPQQLGSSRIILAPYAKDEKYDYISNVFTRTLTQNGYKVLTRAPSTSPADSTLVKRVNPAAANGISSNGAYSLEFQAMDFDLSYPKVYRSYLIGGKKVKRRAKVEIMAKVHDPSDDSVMWVGDSSKSYEDQFPHSQLPEVEAGLVAFAKPEQPKTSWGKIVEPVVVSGIVVGLIYLFFSNQSEN